MTEKEFTFDSILIELTNKVNKEETVYYKNTIRYSNEGVIKDYPIKDIDFSTTANIDCPKDDVDESKTIKMKISSCTDNIPSSIIGEENSIKKNIASYFTSTKYSSNNTVKEGCAWCFNDTSASYVEIVFAVDNILNQNEVDIFTMTF